ncbi:hypothetical protein GGS21DRAFT_527554 [Xylaria nigripes]|nr:hypothetical protein GGS21DRAFT_527554 [Xylaria nigripes]
MASRSMSPGGALLRSSRMFSMPSAIPGSPGDYSSATKHHSATATTPYPTRMTITTPSTSRVRGDWGLKRPLPLKTTIKQTYPLVRIRQMDSLEHITDFQSASDHTMTLKKFQELNLPLLVPPWAKEDTRSIVESPKSVFEREGDVTAIEPEQAEALESKRWNFKGPWLAGMTDGEFNKWLAKRVRPRRAEFRAFLKDIFAKELTKKNKEEAIRNGLPEPSDVVASMISDTQFVDCLREIRHERLRLSRHVSQFLDLAPLNAGFSYINSMSPGVSHDFDRPNPYSENGPPVTHPSAGLSYLRTRNFMENHPVYGPQKNHAVVKARVLKPKSRHTGVYQSVIGVAGFVANSATDQRVATRIPGLSPRNMALSQLDLDKPGGEKLYYKVDYATVNSQGKICIHVSDPDRESELVAKELVGENDPKENVYELAMKGDFMPETSLGVPFPSMARPYPTQLYGSRENYGLGRSSSSRNKWSGG